MGEPPRNLHDTRPLRGEKHTSTLLPSTTHNLHTPQPHHRNLDFPARIQSDHNVSSTNIIMNLVSSLAMLLVLGNHAVAHGQEVVAPSSDQCVRCTRTWARTRTASFPIGFVGCNQTRCGTSAQCPVGACDQT